MMNKIILRGLSLFFFIIFCGLAVGYIAAQTEYKTPQELADPDGSFAELDGVSVYYIARGNPQNPAVIFIHGFGSSNKTWDSAQTALAEAGFYTVALDIPPFGLSDKSPDLPYTRAWMADLIAALMDERSIETASIVGHSMGGGITAYFAVRHPTRVEKLVFVAGGVGAPRQEGQDTRRSGPLSLIMNIDPSTPFAATAIRALVTPQYFADMIADAYYDPSIITEDILQQYQRPLAIEDWPAGFLSYIQAREETPIFLADLVTAAANKPIALIWGEEDTWVPITLGEEMRAALPQALWIAYPLVGHVPMEETPDAFNADLLAFLEDKP